MTAACPTCRRSDCITLRELATIKQRSGLLAWLLGPVNRRVSGYLMQCSHCEDVFTFTAGGNEVVRRGTPFERIEPEPPEDGVAGKPQPRIKPPPWKQAPGL